jgi:hypothetical protein
MRTICRSILLVASLAAAGCVTKEEPVESFDSLLDTGKADAAPAWLLGSLSYGTSSGPVLYRTPPRFRGFSFEGAAGDAVVVDVRSRKGDAVAWVLDSQGNVLGSNDDASPRTLDARVEVTLAQSGTHYIVFRDYWLRRNTFTVDLSGTPVGPPPPTPVMIDEQLLVGVWEGESFADSGNPPEPVPPGTFYRFEIDSMGNRGFAFGCGTQPDATWEIDPNGYTLNVTLGGGSVNVQWVVIRLDAMKLSFVEGGDIFNYKRSSCP